MIDTDVGIFDGSGDFRGGLERRTRTGCVAADQEAHHVDDVVFRTRQPVLQREEVRAHVLCGAGDEAQQLRNPPQHFHLVGAGRAAVLLPAAQALEQRERPALRAIHGESAETREAHDLRRRHGADHRIAIGAAPCRARPAAAENDLP